MFYLSHRTINEKQPYILNKFEKDFIEKSIELEPNIANYIGDFRIIDNRGFFTSTFLREIHKIADKARYSELRSRIEEEFKNILKHIKDFLTASPNTPDELWSRKGEANSYSFLLVARPFHASLRPYIKRSQEHYNNGIERLYVMGANQEKRFVKKVIIAFQM